MDSGLNQRQGQQDLLNMKGKMGNDEFRFFSMRKWEMCHFLSRRKTVGGPNGLGKKLSQELYPVKPFRNEGASLKAIKIKTKINKRDLIELTRFCIAKETIKNNNNDKKTTCGRGENICK